MMRTEAFLSDPRDRARSAAATAAIHVALGLAFVTGLAITPERRTDDGLKTFDVEERIPPPPMTEPSPIATNAPAPAGLKADPSPIVAPPARLPSPQPIAAAPVAGRGPSVNAGAAADGSGTGAGGSGAGRGGGGGGIGAEAQLLSGNRSRLSRALLRPFAANRGFAHLLLTVNERGNVVVCGVIQGTGSAAVDDALCQIMVRQSRWAAARDTAGRPITVQVRYTAIWSKD